MRELIPNTDVTDANDIDSRSRREFVKKALSGSALLLLVHAPGVAALHGRGTGWKQMSTERQYGYVIDLNACIGWGGCIRACKQENQVPDRMFRTWLERYVITGDDNVYVDSPDGGLNGFPPVDDEIDFRCSQRNHRYPWYPGQSQFIARRLLGHSFTGEYPVQSTFFSQAQATSRRS